VDAGLIGPDDMVGRSDEGLLALLEARAGGAEREARRVAERWLPALRERRLPKRALEVPGERCAACRSRSGSTPRRGLRRRLEERLAGARAAGRRRSSWTTRRSRR
jgi:uncharacterized protein